MRARSTSTRSTSAETERTRRLLLGATLRNNRNRLNLQALGVSILDGARWHRASLYVTGKQMKSANNYSFNSARADDIAVSLRSRGPGGNPNLESRMSRYLGYTIGAVIRSTFGRGGVAATELVRRLLQHQHRWRDCGSGSHLTVYQHGLDAQYNPLIGSAAGSHTGRSWR